MLVDPPVTDLLKKVDDRFELITITAKRARQIAQGAHVYTAHEESSPVATAVWEIEEGKVKAVEEDVEENTTEEKSDKEENSEEEE